MNKLLSPYHWQECDTLEQSELMLDKAIPIIVLSMKLFAETYLQQKVNDKPWITTSDQFQDRSESINLDEILKGQKVKNK